MSGGTVPWRLRWKRLTLKRLQLNSVRWNLDLTDSSFSWHVLNRGQNKGFALRKLMEIHDLREDEILVVGDSKNDISMFIEGVNRATMRNGDSELKNLSDYVSSKGDGESIPDIFHKFSLI